MTDIQRPSTDELWQIIQEEQARSRRLEAETQELRQQLDEYRAPKTAIVPAREHPAGRRDHTDQKVSRAKLLGAAGLAGAALIGSQAKPAFAQTPPPIPSLTAFPNPRRVMALAMTYNTISGAISALTSTSGTATGVPAGAQAAWAAVMAYQPGVLTLYPDGTTDTGIGNWAGSGASGLLNMSYMLVPLSAAGSFRVHAYFTATIYVDVWGYLY